VPVSTSYRKGGGARVALVCGVHDCKEKARRAARCMAGAGLPSHFTHVPDAGHVHGGALQETIRAAFEWSVADDPRWH
jgi:hypothetical protein